MRPSDALGRVPFTEARPPSCRVQSARSADLWGSAGLQVFSNSKGSRSAEPNGTPGRFSSLFTRLQSSQITGMQ